MRLSSQHVDYIILFFVFFVFFYISDYCADHRIEKFYWVSLSNSMHVFSDLYMLLNFYELEVAECSSHSFLLVLKNDGRSNVVEESLLCLHCGAESHYQGSTILGARAVLHWRFWRWPTSTGTCSGSAGKVKVRIFSFINESKVRCIRRVKRIWGL